jgi:hypothetical protein
VAWFDFANLRTKYGFHNVKLGESELADNRLKDVELIRIRY